MAKERLASSRSEADEAKWFEENQDALLEKFERAAAEGSLRMGRKSVGITLDVKTEQPVKPPSQKVMLRVPTRDLERARAIAERKGIGYQTYIKMLVHEGVERDSRKTG